MMLCIYIARLAEKKATIGYTYEDSTVTEPDPLSDKGEEEDSENSESEGDEGIPDIGRNVCHVFKARPKCLSALYSWVCLSVVCDCVRRWSGRRRAQSGAGDGAEQNGHTLWNGRRGLCQV